MAAHRDQAKGRAVDPLMRVVAWPPNMRRADQTAICAVTPAVIGAADRPFDLAGFFYKDHAAMAAGVQEHTHHALLVAKQQQRLP